MSNEQIEQIVTFAIEDELFGLPVMEVREIIFPTEIQPITAESKHVVGVILLRGQVISILDFRILLDKPPIERHKKQRIIIVSHQEQLIGLLVDEVAQVVSVSEMEFEAPPKSATSYVFAICKHIKKETIIYMVETKKLIDEKGGMIDAN